jgi:hypothetical protein
MRILSTYIHGMLDYVVGVALIMAPNIFGFSELGGPAVLLPRVLGTAAILVSLLTNYEWGVFRVIPMRVHLVVDFLSGALLAASPWLFGFSHEPSNAWAPHVVVGLMEILVVVMSQTEPRRNLKHA